MRIRVSKDPEKIFARIDKKVAKYGSLSDSDIEQIIQESRQKNRLDS